MKDLPSLLALHSELDRHLNTQRTAAALRNDQAALEKVEGKQRLNDQAYFVLCWGQLEAEIDDVCRAVKRKRQANKDWENRRAWDIYNPEDRRLSGLAFEDRVALLLDKRGGRGSPWALTQSYYALRNQIAHGTVLSRGIELPIVAQHFYAIQGALVR